jgi:UDP-glucose 4-epimerase
VSSERPDRPAPQVALVTGGAGFVGSHLIRRIVEQFSDTTVISIDNYFTGSVDNHVDDPRVQYITASSVDINRM